MKKLTYLSLYESFVQKNKLKKINEGGGAGIEFTAEGNSEYTYRLTANGFELESKFISEIESFDMDGYQDSKHGLDGSLLRMVEPTGAKAEMFSSIKLADLVYNGGDEIVMGEYPNWDADNQPEMTIGEYITANPDHVCLIQLAAHVDYKCMIGAGYITPSFDEGDVILQYSPDNNNNNSDLNSNYSSVNIDGIEYTHERGHNNTEVSSYERILSTIVPTYVATAEFVSFFNNEFYDNSEEDELQDDEIDF